MKERMENEDNNCSYCGKPLRKRYWIGMFTTGQQCDRFFCRLRTGHIFFGTKFSLKHKKVSITIPYIGKAKP